MKTRFLTRLPETLEAQWSVDEEMFIRAWLRDCLCVFVPEAKIQRAVGMLPSGALEATATSGKINRGVGRRRYVANRSVKTIIAWKLFSPFTAVGVGFAILLVTSGNNVCKFRWR